MLYQNQPLNPLDTTNESLHKDLEMESNMLIKTTSIMSRFMSTEQVNCMVAGKGTKISTVEFQKLDGTTRVINGLFKTTSNMVGSKLGIAQGKAMKARGQVPIFELSSRRWKSFYADAVVSVK
jgi:hypothetical protein